MLAAVEHVIAPLVAERSRSAIFLDVDGTLAPIVARAEEATVPAATRTALATAAGRFGLVACVTGRRPHTARAMVGLDSIAYFGNHGAELLQAGADDARLAPEVAEWEPRVREFAASAWRRHPLAELGVRAEDKGPIAGFHWRGVADETAAEALAHEIEREAHAGGLATHWAKKILEVRPPVAFSKGTAVAHLLEGRDLVAAAFIGDDLTDLHAFAALDDAVADGVIDEAIKIGVDSPEAPPGLAPSADLMLTGTDDVRALLELLAAA